MQFWNCFVPDQDLHGWNTVQLQSTVLCKILNVHYCHLKYTLSLLKGGMLAPTMSKRQSRTTNTSLPCALSPLVLQYVQTNGSRHWADVGVPYPRQELNLVENKAWNPTFMATAFLLTCSYLSACTSQCITAQEKTTGEKVPPSKLDPVTYTLTQSFSYTSDGTSHAPPSPIAPSLCANYLSLSHLWCAGPESSLLNPHIIFPHTTTYGHTVYWNDMVGVRCCVKCDGEQD